MILRVEPETPFGDGRLFAMMMGARLMGEAAVKEASDVERRLVRVLVRLCGLGVDRTLIWGEDDDIMMMAQTGNDAIMCCLSDPDSPALWHVGLSPGGRRVTVRTFEGAFPGRPFVGMITGHVIDVDGEVAMRVTEMPGGRNIVVRRQGILWRSDTPLDARSLCHDGRPEAMR